MFQRSCMKGTAVAFGLLSICLTNLPAQQKSKADSKPSSTTPKTSKTVVPVFSFNGPILESPAPDDPFFGNIGGESLKDLIARLEKARIDKQVPAIVLLIDNTSIGTGQLEEIYKAIKQIRDEGKPVYGHVDHMSFGLLALLSSSSRISVTPVGELFITGLYGAQPHFRGLLDKIHVTPDFLTCGDYKSAGEMYMRKQPSPEAEEMYGWLFDGIYETYLKMIADGRGQELSVVRKYIDYGIYSSAAAKKAQIIDATESRHDFIEFVKQKHGADVKLDKRYGRKKRKTIDFNNPFVAFQIWADLLKGSSPKVSKKDSVAIVYVEGPIMVGKSQPSPFGSQGIAYSNPIRKALDKAAADDTVKAVVLRVNSPGGSAVGSEVILQATRRVAANKPLIVSMGNVAGSGGYYVSCGTDTIFADESTITASIGVVAGKLATDKMWESVGINWHPIERGKNSGMLYSGKVFSEEQKKMMQSWMDEIYGDFKSHVMTARGDRLKKPLEEIAGGRVFTGRQALELGLVDRIGTLDDAIRFAAQKANLQKYEIRVIPRPKNIMELMMADLTGAGKDDEQISLSTDRFRSWKTLSVWKSAIPLLDKLEPRRSASLRRALIQLEVLQREGLTLATPEIAFGH